MHHSPFFAHMRTLCAVHEKDDWTRERRSTDIRTAIRVAGEALRPIPERSGRIAIHRADPTRHSKHVFGQYGYVEGDGRYSR